MTSEMFLTSVNNAKMAEALNIYKEIPHGILPMEQLVLSDKWARKQYVRLDLDPNCLILKQCCWKNF